MINRIDNILKDIGKRVEMIFNGKIDSKDYYLSFRTYGKNGVMGEVEPCKEFAHELFTIIDVIGKT